MKNLFVEKYDPLFMSYRGGLLKPKLHLRSGIIFNLLFIVGAIVLAVIYTPVWLFAIAASMVFFGLFDGKMFVRESMTIPSHMHHSPGVYGLPEWHCSDTIKTSEAYSQHLLEYLDHLRYGGDHLVGIEDELIRWIRLEKDNAQRIKTMQKEILSESLSRRDQLDEYEKLLTQKD